jgi:hypothetical protein
LGADGRLEAIRTVIWDHDQALRAGNASTLLADHLPEDYQTPPFQLNLLAVDREIILVAANQSVGDYIDIAGKAWKKMTRKYAVENAIIEPMVFLAANDNWLEFTLRYVVDFKKRRGAKDLLFTHILDAIAQTGGKVSLASATFQLVDAPTLDVRLRKEGLG